MCVRTCACQCLHPCIPTQDLFVVARPTEEYQKFQAEKQDFFVGPVDDLLETLITFGQEARDSLQKQGQGGRGLSRVVRPLLPIPLTLIKTAC